MGDCSYDIEKMMLSRDDLSVTLGGNENDMLLALIEGVSEKEELISRIWGGRGIVVSDSSYYKTIHTLRENLVAIGLPRQSLKTLPRRGLILLCEVSLTPSVISPAADEGVEEEVSSRPSTELIERVDDGVTVERVIADDSVAATNEVNEQVIAPDAFSVKERAGLIRRNVHLMLPCIVLCGTLLPLAYAYLMYQKPPDLEEWKLVWQEANGELYVEESESMSKEDVLHAMSDFEKPLVMGNINFYVRKPLTQLLINCVRPESKGEALCVNYLRVGKKR